ncbi:cupredoxin domain-containing protein [Fredinandcohnia sp. QZ13]|uniref:cupredoxin domain-containing protein n=1 Tax=Fredinandcohnia sp. QZ13 TaxID=3073144 RepID=UPI00285355BE|nr:cupredoxin domain-containing protein [Fredinandcohnia sp. QZ13]MDR4890184.1 cupredoxin domain-containing protein [Fredinandcohnia sp. QZ13]
MSAIKWLTSLSVILALFVVGSMGVFAETQPLEPMAKFEVEINDDYFNPKAITLPQGKPFVLVLKNNGVKEHTFTVEKLGIDYELKPKQIKIVTVGPKTPGTYELICRYHSKEGMTGQVIVK